MRKAAEDSRFGFGNKCDGSVRQCRRSAWAIVLVSLSILLSSLSGRTTKSQAKAQARDAFVAGEQAALARVAQTHKPMVSFIGPVKNPTIPWTHELTLAKAILAAGYLGSSEPTQIMIVRNAQAIPIDPKRLLSGEDIPLASGDLIQINQ